MNCVEEGQGQAGCQNEAVLLVDIAGTIVAGTETSEGGETFAVPVDVPSQRLGYCVLHGPRHGLTAAVTKGDLVRGDSGEPFPGDHSFAEEWSWRLTDV